MSLLDNPRIRSRIREDLTGRKFSLLTVIDYFGNSKWKCSCECGKVNYPTTHQLLAGKVRSCGCQISVASKKRNYRHGFSGSPEHTAWANMNYRCTNEKARNFEHYGGRGISVCERWANSFLNFLSDMGYRPSPQHTLERKDNSGNYCPENCEWANREIQYANRRGNIFLTFEGKSQTITQWAKEKGINANTLRARIARNWPDSEIFSPLKPGRRRFRQGNPCLTHRKKE